MGHRGSRRATAFAVGVVATAAALVGCSSTPEVDEAPLPTSQSDATAQYAACLEDRGWDVEVEGDAVNVNDIPNEPAAQYEADSNECHTAVFDWGDRLTTEQWQEWYDLTVEATDCLEAAGYTIEGLPSLQRFTDLAGNWSPYDQLVTTGLLQGSLEEVEQQCPQPVYWPS